MVLYDIAGAELQKMFFTFKDMGKDEDYEQALGKFKAYFKPQRNTQAEYRLLTTFV